MPAGQDLIMAYYRILLAVLVVLVVSVFMQGRDLFTDEFFLIAYVVMAIVLLAGTRYRKSFGSALGIGLLMIFSIGALSTWVMFSMITGSMEVFKLAVVISLDVCAILFLQEARNLRFTRQEGSGGMFWKGNG